MVYSIQYLKIVPVLVVENSPTALLLLAAHVLRYINFALLLLAAHVLRDINYFERSIMLIIFSIFLYLILDDELLLILV